MKLVIFFRECSMSYGCIPFDQMPFCTSLVGHNPRYWDVFNSIDVTDRSHELLARRIKNNVRSSRNTLYSS